jgi:signal transduction histidine kinase
MRLRLFILLTFLLGGMLLVCDVPWALTGALRRSVADTWLVAGGVGVVAVGAAAVAAAALTRWILRPVSELDRAAHAFESGDMSVRVPEGVGPPELRRLARSFNAMAKTVSAAIAQQRVFAAEASHQMRTPLTALFLRLSNIADDLPARAQGEYEEARREGVRLERLLDELLALARAERHLGEVRAQDVGVLVTERLRAWRVRAQEAGVLLVRGGESIAVAVVDAESLTRAVDELLDNAVKYAAQGGLITVTLEQRLGEVRVTVADQGPGLLPEELLHVTERFWRSRGHANVAGSGLGLSIVAALLATFGAGLEVTANDPHGLAVTIVAATPERTPPSRLAASERC